MNVEVGDGAERVAGGAVESLGPEEAKPDNVATEDEEFERVGLLALAVGVGNDGFEIVEGDGRVWAGVGAGPG